MNEVFAYMKAAIEGNSGLPPFARWCHDHAKEIEALCGRGSYLRLKHGDPLAEFRQILSKHGIPFANSPNAYLPRGPSDCSWIPVQWLTKRVFPYQHSPTVYAQALTHHIDEYLHMVDIKETGDELWHFSSSDESWKNMMGVGGIALVRNGKIVSAIVLMRS